MIEADDEADLHSGVDLADCQFESSSGDKNFLLPVFSRTYIPEAELRYFCQSSDSLCDDLEVLGAKAIILVCSAKRRIGMDDAVLREKLEKTQRELSTMRQELAEVNRKVPALEASERKVRADALKAQEEAIDTAGRNVDLVHEVKGLKQDLTRAQEASKLLEKTASDAQARVQAPSEGMRSAMEKLKDKLDAVFADANNYKSSELPEVGLSPEGYAEWLAKEVGMIPSMLIAASDFGAFEGACWQLLLTKYDRQL